MQPIIQLVAVLALLLSAPVVAQPAASAALASPPAPVRRVQRAADARLVGPSDGGWREAAPALLPRSTAASASGPTAKTGEIVNCLLGAMLLALSVTTLGLLGQRRALHQPRWHERIEA